MLKKLYLIPLVPASLAMLVVFALAAPFAWLAGIPKGWRKSQTRYFIALPGMPEWFDLGGGENLCERVSSFADATTDGVVLVRVMASKLAGQTYSSEGTGAGRAF